MTPWEQSSMRKVQMHAFPFCLDYTYRRPLPDLPQGAYLQAAVARKANLIEHALSSLPPPTAGILNSGLFATGKASTTIFFSNSSSSSPPFCPNSSNIDSMALFGGNDDDDDSDNFDDRDGGESDDIELLSIHEGGDSVTEIEIEKIGQNSRRIQSKIAVDASLQAVWNILTDYERLPDFIPGLAVSQLLEKRDNFVRLFQIGQQKLAFGISFNAKGIIDCYEKDIENLPFSQRRDIEFKMIEGDFRQFEGKWSLEQKLGVSVQCTKMRRRGFLGRPRIPYNSFLCCQRGAKTMVASWSC